MSQPTPKRPDSTRPAAQQPAKGQIPVAKRLEPPVEKAAAKTPAAKDEAARAKSLPVISKSYRVRELPPPPVVAPPEADHVEEGSQHRDTMPDGLAMLAEKPPESPVELGALQIGSPGAWNFLRRRARGPSRWEQWLADPKRRNKVGVAASMAIHVVLLVLLVFVLHAPLRMPATELIHARVVQPAVGEMAPDKSVRIEPCCEPVVRQITAGELETVGLTLTENVGSEISDLRSEISDSKSDKAVKAIAREAIIGPPVTIPGAPSTPPADSEARVAATVEGSGPGLAGGSHLPPDLLQAIDTGMQGKLKRRTPDGRGEGVRYGGGTPQSEEAVERALRWLAAHQRQEGSWNFNHLSDACQHYCTQPGSEASTTAATGLSLLPFLGAGYTHKKGEFQDVVERGLDYLKSHGIKISYGNDLRDGSMYGHALATIALCEAYGMSRDSDLKQAAQGAVDYIAYAQDNNTGGWRYNPGEPGDTTVTGWMLMGLKSGQIAGLNVKSPAIFAAQRFLNSVQNPDGSQYGYQSRQPRPTTTAVGLLCRMYTGWRRNNPGLVKGVAQLNAWGPSPDSLYYDYYATQVLFHWAGPEWDAWNRKMRERLISTQERVGHQSGSWYFESQQSAAGGRLYNTAMAAMILEVYYRFMPLYGEEAIEEK